MPGLSRLALPAAVLLATACGPTPETPPADTDPGTTSTDPTTANPTTTNPPDTTADTGTGPTPDGPVAVTTNTDVDLLFVVDNSASMAGAQQTLATAIPQLVDAFETAGINYRIGITTTDNGNPWCAGTTPEGGSLVLSSCRSRLSEFDNPVGTSEQAACLDVCPLETLDVIPTTTASDPSPTPRPWIEVTGGVSNIANASPTEALACALPQGVAGCGFEQPLESAYRALLRTNDDNDPGFGFLRASAVLGVVVITDEADCSHSLDHETIFLPEGDRTFWSDPAAGAPTSAVCWNAGVACSGSSCNSVNLDEVGNMTDPDNAVMRPVSRYVELLQEFEDQKQQIVPDQQVVFAVIGGVGSDGSVTYADGSDPQYLEDYGIGPGCTSADLGAAVPPVRMREVAEAMLVGDEQSLFSVCAADYGNYVAAVANLLRSQVRPACVPVCVADTDPTTQALEEQCVVVLEEPAPDGTLIETTLAQCSGGVPAGEDHCWTPLTGDERSDACADEGWNLELRFEHAPGASFAPGAQVTAECALSASKNVDCPELP